MIRLVPSTRTRSPRGASPFSTILLSTLLFSTMIWLAACGSSSPAEEVAPAVTAVPVRVQQLVAQSVQDVVQLPADLLPLRRAVLAAEVNGVVGTLNAEVGDSVNRGRVLARVDTRALEQALAEAEAVHRQASAQFERAERLFERRSITKQQMLDAVTQRDVAQARLANARLQLDKSRLTAPWAGTIASKRVEVGDYVVPGQAMLELLDDSRLKVRAAASASDLPYLQVGSPVSIRVDGLSATGDASVQGKIVRLAAELDPQARTLDLEAEIDNRDGRLRPGMLAWVQVERQTLENVVLVPQDAVMDLAPDKAMSKAVYVVETAPAGTANPSGGQSDRQSYGQSGTVARRRVVELGPVQGDAVVVLSGLAAGERVIVEGQQQVGEGQVVRVVGS